MTVPEKMVVLHEHLRGAAIEHAFGGALALAWCTLQARGTLDIDLNLFLPPERADEAVAALPPDVRVSAADRSRLARDGQVRLWWNETPVDLFLDTTEFHEGVAGRIRWEPFAGRELPFLSCRDLAVFKAMFNRTRDWADLEAMAEAGSLDVEHVLGVVTLYLGGDDERVDRLRRLERPRQ